MPYLLIHEVLKDEPISSTSMTSDVRPVSLHPLICFILHHSALLEMGHEVSALFSLRAVAWLVRPSEMTRRTMSSLCPSLSLAVSLSVFLLLCAPVNNLFSLPAEMVLSQLYLASLQQWDNYPDTVGQTAGLPDQKGTAIISLTDLFL